MSAELLASLEAARKELLEAQRKCGYCNAVFATVDDLIKHLQLECPVKKAEGLIL
jgi:hypothetical protein